MFKKLLFIIISLLITGAAFSQSVDGALKTLVASGIDTYIVSEPLPAGYLLNERFIVRFTNANTGAATLNRNGLGAKSIVKNGSTALAAGDIVAGQAYIIQYNGTNYQIVNTLGGSSGGVINGTNIYGATTNNYVSQSIYFFGDSKTVGVGQPNSYTKWPSRVSAILGMTQVNKGVSGQTMSPGGNSMQNRFAEIPTYNATTIPYLFFSYSTNDLQSAIPTATFQTAYQACLDAAYAKGWPPSAIYVLNQTPDPGYEASVTAYNVVINGLPSLFVRNNGLNVVNVYGAYPTVGYARYFNGPHETEIGSDITAQAVIAKLPLQEITKNSQAGAFNGLVEAQKLRIKNTVLPPNVPYSFVVADSTGSLLLKRSNSVFINNSLNTQSQQVADIDIDGHASSNGSYAYGNASPLDVTKAGVLSYYTGGAGYIQSGSFDQSINSPLNFRGGKATFPSIVQATSYYSGAGGVGTALLTSGGIAYVWADNSTNFTTPMPMAFRASYSTFNNKVYVGTESSPTAWLQLRAGSTAANSGPMKYTSGPLTTTAEAGLWEYEGTAFYATAVANSRQVVDAEQFVSLTATYTLTSQTALQKLFNSTTNGALTVQGSTSYFFECEFDLSSLSASSGDFSFGFGGTATFSSLKYTADASKSAVGTPSTSQMVTATVATATSLVTANTTTTGHAYITGIVRINAGGTLIPQVGLGVAAAGVVGANSWFRLTAIGTNTITNVGNWN